MKKLIKNCLRDLRLLRKFNSTMSINSMCVNYYGKIERYKHSFKNKETEIIIAFYQEWNGNQDIVYDEPSVVKYTVHDNDLEGFIIYGISNNRIKSEFLLAGTK